MNIRAALFLMAPQQVPIRSLDAMSTDELEEVCYAHYAADKQTHAWKQIAAELPHPATAFAVEGRTFYIGTQQNGVFRFQRDNL